MTMTVAAPAICETVPVYDLDRVRADFPILAQKVHGHPLAYLDNAASTQKPRAVAEALAGCYGEYYANVERGVHTLSQRSTEARERARETVRRFLNAPSAEEIVFVRGTTEAINLVAASWGRRNVGPGDEVLITELEHHSNIIPWQLLCEERGAVLRVAPIDDRGEVILEELERLLSSRTRLVAVAHMSNALGTINPVRAIADRAHAAGALVLVDGAQSAPHLGVDVQALGCDFFAFSGHKVYGPSGIGVLWGRAELLAAMPPWQGGGGMVRTVSFAKTTYAPPPHRFEAGTPAIEAAVGLGAALDYLTDLGLPAVAAWETGLLALATERLAEVPGLAVIGTARDKAAVLSFRMEGIHPHDVGTILDGEGIAVRAGHHCAQPVMEHFRVPATTRASFGLYNTREEVAALAAALHRARELFG
ncbi:MAG: cysteine desulfurase / selenocysteine lyase [Acidobacteriota bacterium]|jgi:cysteine desulfurase/selenocysteine lyase|nr:cysteine desulfurase / selenocysteine lyase [Acidobacteriota bacterium]